MGQALRAIEETGTKRQGGHRGGKAQKYVMTEQQRRILLDGYDGRTETLDDLMRFFPGVPRKRVTAWAAQLGLTRRQERRWTQEEMDYLEQHLCHMSLDTLARKLNRTKTAVRLRAKRLEINKTQQEGYTMRGLCLGLGVSHHRVAQWLERGWLKGVRRQTERQWRDTWLFRDKAVKRFIKEHPEEIDPRRFDWIWVVDLLTDGLGELGAAERREAEEE
jgi:hypothetical protein